MNITPNLEIASFCQGSLNVSYERIVEVLGEPNVDDDPDKVTYSWGYNVDGEPVAIWDYKGHRWSYCGKHEVLKKLFGDMAVSYNLDQDN